MTEHNALDASIEMRNMQARLDMAESDCRMLRAERDRLLQLNRQLSDAKSDLTLTYMAGVADGKKGTQFRYKPMKDFVQKIADGLIGDFSGQAQELLKTLDSLEVKS